MSGLDSGRLAIRQGTLADHAALSTFTTDTWGEDSDYIPYVYPRWMAAEGETQRTFVAVDYDADLPKDADSVLPEGAEPDQDLDLPADATRDPSEADGRAIGVCQAVKLSEHEGWVQGMRVDPAYQGEGLSTALNDAAFRWLAEQGCVVARNMVFSWNMAGLGGSQAAGFDPCTEFRWARPRPDSDADPGGNTTTGDDTAADAVWSFWQGCDARTHLRGLVLDADESWSLSELTRERLRHAAAEGRLVTVEDDGISGFSIRNRTYTDEDGGEKELNAEYAVGAWSGPAACADLMAAIARDAAAEGADKTRVLIPETVQWVADVAAARVEVSEEPDFVMAGDLTTRPWDRD